MCPRCVRDAKTGHGAGLRDPASGQVAPARRGVLAERRTPMNPRRGDVKGSRAPADEFGGSAASPAALGARSCDRKIMTAGSEKSSPAPCPPSGRKHHRRV